MEFDIFSVLRVANTLSSQCKVCAVSSQWGHHGTTGWVDDRGLQSGQIQMCVFTDNYFIENLYFFNSEMCNFGYETDQFTNTSSIQTQIFHCLIKQVEPHLTHSISWASVVPICFAQTNNSILCCWWQRKLHTLSFIFNWPLYFQCLSSPELTDAPSIKWEIQDDIHFISAGQRKVVVMWEVLRYLFSQGHLWCQCIF